MPNYEYTTEVLTHGFLGRKEEEFDRQEFEERLNALGAEGWEFEKLLTAHGPPRREGRPRADLQARGGLERAAGDGRRGRVRALVAELLAREVLLDASSGSSRERSTTRSRSDIVATSSICSLMNHCMNCSRRVVAAARARAPASALICSVTRFSCSSASATGLDDVVEARLRRGHARARGVDVLVEQVLHHHHRVVALLERLRVEERGEARAASRRRSSTAIATYCWWAANSWPICSLSFSTKASEGMGRDAYPIRVS